jgi:phosphoglycolate phosphatase
MREEYLGLYDEVFTRSPVMFPGIAELLLALENNNLRWGIVTNKPGRFTKPLLEAMGLDRRACCIVSGDDAARPKPYPDTLLLAMKQADTEPACCLYVGDAERDIQAARAAGIASVIALYGYLDESDRPEEWGATATISSPMDILRLIPTECVSG